MKDANSDMVEKAEARYFPPSLNSSFSFSEYDEIKTGSYPSDLSLSASRIYFFSLEKR